MIAMKWHIYNDPRQFLEQVGAFLERHEAENSLALGILHSLAEGKRRMEGEPVMAAVKEGDEPILIVLMTPPKGLILAGKPPKLGKEALLFAANSVMAMNISVPGVIGDPVLAAEFIRAWERNTQCSSEVVMNQRIYRLDRVLDMDYSPGQLRVATAEDIHLTAEWLYQFAKEVGELISHEQALAKARNGVEERSLYLWEDKKAVSMAMMARPTASGVTINMVYTPAEFRGKGYATSCVASLSQLLLDRGYRFCTLYTDLANNTSNKIYQTIGYKPIQDSILYRFI